MMRRFRLALSALALLSLSSVGAAAGEPAAPALTVTLDEFSYLDTSGEPTDQSAAHRQRLQAFMATLRKGIEGDQHYRLVPSACDGPCREGSTPESRAPGEARIRIIGGIQKMSTLVQLAKMAVVDTANNRVLSEKLYTFRGDNDQAWDRAAAFVSREIGAALPVAAPAPVVAPAPVPVVLAVFEFEIEDTTAAAQATVPADTAHLADVTNEVRKLLAQSGRYRVVEIGDVKADAIEKRDLRDCDGCDAAIALKLGAEQSLIGVVRRVSRTEYTIGFQVRDAKTGAVVSRGDSGLRMGADYAWSRGAVRLIGDHLLASASQQ